MSIRINWSPVNAGDIYAYEIQRAANLNGSPWSVIATVISDLTGPNYDTVNATFFYADATGTVDSWYRLIAIDRLAQRSAPSAPFQAPRNEPAVPNNVRLDHNYGSAGALRYQAANGAPVENAIIRVFKKTDFDQGRRDNPLAVTLTNADGNWVNPIFVTTGFTYVVQFAKEGLYGPDKVEVIA